MSYLPLHGYIWCAHIRKIQNYFIGMCFNSTELSEIIGSVPGFLRCLFNFNRKESMENQNFFPLNILAQSNYVT